MKKQDGVIPILFFYLSEKTKRKAANLVIEDDMEKPQQRRKRSRKTSKIGDLFKAEFSGEVEINPVYDKVPTARVIYYTMEQIIARSKELNLTQAVFIERMRLKPVGDEKRYYKEY